VSATIKAWSLGAAAAESQHTRRYNKLEERSVDWEWAPPREGRG